MLAVAGCVAASSDETGAKDTADTSTQQDTSTCDDPPSLDEFVPAFTDEWCPWAVTCEATSVVFAGDVDKCRDYWVRVFANPDLCTDTCLLDECAVMIADAAAAGECTEELYDQVWDDCVERLDCGS